MDGGDPITISRRATGIITWSLLAVIAGVVFYPLLLRPSGPSGAPRCSTGLKQVGLATDLYSQDNDGRLPPAQGWTSALQRYLKGEGAFRCPLVKDASVPSIGYNDGLRSVRRDSVAEPGRVVMHFDARPGQDTAGGVSILPDPPRHEGGHNICFVDGHVQHVKASRIPELAWRPEITRGPPRPTSGDRVRRR